MRVKKQKKMKIEEEKLCLLFQDNELEKEK